VASPLWALVLSENHGLRTSALLGGVARPMWLAAGEPSRLEQALDRVSALVPGARTVTVIGPTQRAAAASLRRAADPGFVVRQPGDRGTAPGVLLGLAAILEIRPDALVVVTPTECTIRDRDQFTLSARDATHWVASGRDEVVLFGARPATASWVPRWVVPGPVRPGGPRLLHQVEGLTENPESEEVAGLLRRQALWNTQVVVARAQGLFDLYERHLPHVTAMLGRVLQAAPRERAVRLEDEYRVLRPADFARDVLARAEALSVYAWPATIGYAPAEGGGLPAMRPRPAKAAEPRRGWTIQAKRALGG